MPTPVISGENNPAPPRSLPPGGVKIADAFRLLLSNKNFSDITIEDIVNTSGVNSALIYKYYGDKRGLLYQVLSDGLDRFNTGLARELKGIKGALNKLRKIIWLHVNLYRENRITARIMLIEARSHHSFFESEAHKKIRQYNAMVREIIAEGINEGDIRQDIPVWMINNTLMGSIEHLCLPWLISGEEISEETVDTLADDLCTIFFSGIETGRSSRNDVY
jgi:TetR/AcrR family transcriptional regulator, fatty acid metabolism regulator protein